MLIFYPLVYNTVSKTVCISMTNHTEPSLRHLNPKFGISIGAFSDQVPLSLPVTLHMIDTHSFLSLVCLMGMYLFNNKGGVRFHLQWKRQDSMICRETDKCVVDERYERNSVLG